MKKLLFAVSMAIWSAARFAPRTSSGHGKERFSRLKGRGCGLSAKLRGRMIS
jgi:hypothetical protein